LLVASRSALICAEETSACKSKKKRRKRIRWLC
jgi:hypothetical protein